MKIKPKEEKKAYLISINKCLMDNLDKKRELYSLSRSSFIEQLIENYFTITKAKGNNGKEDNKA